MVPPETAIAASLVTTGSTKAMLDHTEPKVLTKLSPQALKSYRAIASGVFDATTGCTDHSLATADTLDIADNLVGLATRGWMGKDQEDDHLPAATVSTLASLVTVMVKPPGGQRTTTTTTTHRYR